VFSGCAQTKPRGLGRRYPHPGISLGRELGAIAQAPFSGKPFQEAEPPEKPSGKNSQGVKEGVKPHLPKSMHGKGGK